MVAPARLREGVWAAAALLLVLAAAVPKGLDARARAVGAGAQQEGALKANPAPPVFPDAYEV